MKDVFLISAESAINRVSSLMNRASRTYYGLKEPGTAYGKSLYACYILNKRIYDSILITIKDYKHGKLEYPVGKETI